MRWLAAPRNTSGAERVAVLLQEVVLDLPREVVAEAVGQLDLVERVVRAARTRRRRPTAWAAAARRRCRTSRNDLPSAVARSRAGDAPNVPAPDEPPQPPPVGPRATAALACRRVADPAFYRSRSFWLDQLDDDPLHASAGAAGPSRRRRRHRRRRLHRPVDRALPQPPPTRTCASRCSSATSPASAPPAATAAGARPAADEPHGAWPPATGATRAIALQRTMHDTVDEVGRAAAELGIDCHFAKGGYVHLATAPLQLGRLQAELAESRAFGFGDERRALARPPRGARPESAPTACSARVVHARTARRSSRRAWPAAWPRRWRREGVSRSTRGRRCEAIEPGRGAHRRSATCARRSWCGRPRASRVQLAGERRTVAPVYSLMVATEPLPRRRLGRARLRRPPDLQRRPPPHHLRPAHRRRPPRLRRPGRARTTSARGSTPGFDRDERVFEDLRSVLAGCSRRSHGTAITHALGRAARRPARLALLGGLRPGHRPGVGRRLRRRRRGHDEPGRPHAGRPHHRPRLAADVPWRGSTIARRRWEPEPFRWLGINGALRLTGAADAVEARTGKPSRWRGRVLDRLTGG